MLPYKFCLDNLDKGIRNVVINLNRIAGVFTNTTCEGHIWRDCPAWPTKDGWIHFNVQEKTNLDLVPRIKKEFIEIHPIFELNDFETRLCKGYSSHTISAHYESHDFGRLFDRINEQEQENYFERAEKRREKILNGWENLDKVIISYLKDNFQKDYEKLPFVEIKP